METRDFEGRGWCKTRGGNYEARYDVRGGKCEVGVKCVAENAYGRQNKRARSAARIYNLKCDTKPQGAKVRLETKLRGAMCSWK